MNTVGFNNFENIRQLAQERNNIAPRSQAAATQSAPAVDWRTILEAKRKEQNLDSKIPKVDIEKIRSKAIEMQEAPSVKDIIAAVGNRANHYMSGTTPVNNVDLRKEPTKRILGNYVDLMA